MVISLGTLSAIYSENLQALTYATNSFHKDRKTERHFFQNSFGNCFVNCYENSFENSTNNSKFRSFQMELKQTFSKEFQTIFTKELIFFKNGRRNLETNSCIELSQNKSDELPEQLPMKLPKDLLIPIKGTPKKLPQTISMELFQ